MATTVLMASPTTAQVGSQLIQSSAMDRIVARRRREVAERHALARQCLGDFYPSTVAAEGLQLWLPLPEPWRAAQLVAACRTRGVLVASPELFAIGRAAAPHAVRLSIGAVASPDDLRQALGIISELLAGPPPGAGGRV